MVTVFGLSACLVASAVFVRRGVTVVGLQLVIAVVFVVLGMIVLGSGRDEDWSATPILVTATGLLVLALAALPGIEPRRDPRRALDMGTPVSNAEMTVRVGVIVVVLSLVTSYFVLLGGVPILVGLRDLVVSGGVVNPGLTNTARISRDVYVNPDATYIPAQGFLESLRYFGCITTTVLAIDLIRRRRAVTFGYVVVLYSVMMVVATGQRWPLMYLWAGVALYYSMSASVPLRFWAWSGIGAFAFGVVLSVLLGRTGRSLSGFAEVVVFGVSDLVDRVVTGYVVVPFASYGIPPDVLAAYPGATWVQSLAAFLPGPGASYPVTFYQTVTGDPIGFTASPDIWTEAWINLGWFGVVASSLVAFAAAAMVDRGLRARARSREPGLRVALLLPIGVACVFAPFSGLVFILGSVVVSVFVCGVAILLRLVAPVSTAGPAAESPNAVASVRVKRGGVAS